MVAAAVAAVWTAMVLAVTATNNTARSTKQVPLDRRKAMANAMKGRRGKQNETRVDACDTATKSSCYRTRGWQWTSGAS